MTSIIPTKIIVGAPFGNYFRSKNTTATIGTFTLHKRAGFIKRWWKVLSTVRYHRRSQSWINKLGLPNPGVQSVGVHTHDKIISIYGYDPVEWVALVDYVTAMRPLAIEFNLSCPNVDQPRHIIADVDFAIRKTLSCGVCVIAKLPPVRWMDYANYLYGIGVRYFHVCNTMSTPGGGMGGKILRPYVRWAISDLRNAYGSNVTIVAGGGVTCNEDVLDYIHDGANHVAIASCLLNPLNWWRVPKWI